MIEKHEFRDGLRVRVVVNLCVFAAVEVGREFTLHKQSGSTSEYYTRSDKRGIRVLSTCVGCRKALEIVEECVVPNPFGFSYYGQPMNEF